MKPEEYKEYNNSIFYLEGRNVIEYNILSKKKYVHYRFLNGLPIWYFINEHNKVFVYTSYRRNIMEWNNWIIYLGLNNIYGVYFLGSSTGEQYIAVRFCKLIKIFRSGHFIKKIYRQMYYDISSDGCKISFYDRKRSQLYIANTMDILNAIFSKTKFQLYPSDMKSIFKKISDCIDFPWKSFPQFINNSYRFVISIFESIIENVKTLSKTYYNIDGELYYEIYDTGEFLICTDHQSIYVYDAIKLRYLKTIKYSGQKIYNSKLNLLIINNDDYYRLDSSCELQKVNLSLNYMNDRVIVSNAVMDIVLSDYLLFDLLPNEILCIELYSEVINNAIN